MLGKKMIELDNEEKDILETFDRGEWKSVNEVKSKARQYAKYAHETFRKDRRVNIRISSKDLEGIQAKALEEGLPYQTFIASILHKFISGRLIEKF